MFGYVVPDKPNMFVKDFTLYRAYYCGLCKSIGKKCGQCMRFATNYDTTFLNILLHGVKNISHTLKKEACVLSPFKKKPIVVDDELSRQVVDTNTLLAYYKVQDDIVDGKSFAKRMAKAAMLERKFKKAKKALPKVDEIIKDNYEKLRGLEREKCPSIDMSAEPFGQMLKQVVKELCGDGYSDELGEMMYFIGKWIYTMDALDDVDEDNKSGNYNPFLQEYSYNDFDSFMEEKGQDVKFSLMSDYESIKENFRKIKLEVNEGVLTNIIWYGLLFRTNEILGRNSKCKKIRFQF